VVDWKGRWGLWREFPIDMAAFAVSVNLILSRPEVKFHIDWKPGYLETNFVKSLGVSQDRITPQPDTNCSQVSVYQLSKLE
jgi:hypothetical protein